MKWFSKALAILLAIVIGIAAIPAAAAKDDPDAVPTGANNGPSESCSYIKASLSQGDKFSTIIYSYADDILQSYGDKLVYDKSANTLTVKDLEAYALDINEMGEDFKIVVEGYNKLNYITVWGFGWGGSAYITGDGVLDLDFGLGLEAEDSDSVLTIDSDVSVYSHNGMIYVSESTAAQPMVIKGRELSGGTAGYYRRSPYPIKVSYGADGYTRDGRVYRNTTKPFSNYSGHEDDEYFVVIDSPESYEQHNGEWRNCNKFEILSAVMKDGEWMIDSILDYLYVWDDSILYQMYAKDPERMRISDVDPHYVEVDTGHEYKEMAVIRDAKGEPMNDIAIVPKSSGELARPQLVTDTLPDATVGKPYSVQLVGQPGNAGGEIIGYSLTTSDDDSDWLTLDSNGVLSGTAPSDFGLYDIKAAVIEKVGDKELRSVTKKLTVKVDIPDNCVLFGKTIATGCSHILTVKDSSGKTVRTFYLGTKELTPATCIDLGELPDGSYQAILTGDFFGEEIIYNGNTESFTVAAGQKTRVTLDPDTEIAYPESSVQIKVNDFEYASQLSDLHAIVTLSTGETVTCQVTRALTVIPNCLSDGAEVAHISLTAKDDSGQSFEIASSDGGELYVDTETFATYTVRVNASDIGGIRLSLNNYPFAVHSGREYVLKKLTGDDILTFSSAAYTESNKKSYDLSAGCPIIYYKNYESGDNDIFVDYPILNRFCSVGVTVVDSKGDPVAGIPLVCSQTINGIAINSYGITDADGYYHFSELYDSKDATISVCKTGYQDITKTIEYAHDAEEITLMLDDLAGVNVRCADYVSGGRLRWSGADSGVLSFSGYSAVLPIVTSVNGTLSVTLTGENIAGEITGTVTVKNGRGELMLEPAKKGTIDWSGVGDQDSEIASYTAYPIRITGENYSKLFSARNCGYVNVDPGEYTVSILKPDSDKTYATQKLTVRAGETAYVTVTLPADAKQTGVSSGTLTGPRTASSGEAYKLSGLITSVAGKEINYLRFQIGDTMSWSDNIDHVVINGKSAAIQNGYVYKNSSGENADIDWSLPLNFTVYCTQNADTVRTSQTVTAYVAADDEEALIGTVVTKYIPNLTLTTVSAVGVTVTANGDVIPDSVSYTGKCAPTTQIKLYDNDTLCAVATSDAHGNYSGTLNLKSISYYHTIRAEADFGGETVTAKSRVKCISDGAVLQSLEMNGDPIPISGGKIAYVTVPTGNIRFSATFKNADMLDDITYTIHNEAVTSKVFFKVSTLSGYELLPAMADRTGDSWTTDNYFHGVDYPTGVKALYKSKAIDYTYTAEFDDLASVGAGAEEALAATGVYASSFTRAVERTDSYDKNNYAPIYDYNGWIGDFTGNHEAWNDSSMSADKSDELYREVVAALNRNEGSGKNGAKAITAEQAAARCPANEAQVRTYVDSPAYTVNDQNLKLRKDELDAKGYESYYYKDRTSGHVLCMFKGTFYYDKNAQPVASLTKTNIYNGMPVTEEDERMFKDGKPLGTTLDVTYVCDLNAKKWVRTQTAILSPGAASPIHTYSTQVPGRQEAPFGYKQSAVSPVSLSADDAASTGSSVGTTVGENYHELTGFSISIDPKDVSARTYGQFGVAVVSFGVGAYMAKGGVQSTKVLNEYCRNSATVIDPTKGAKIARVINEVDYESIVAAESFCQLGNGIGSVLKGPNEPYDAYENMQHYLTNNIRWYGRVESVAKQTNKTNNGGSIGDFSATGVMASYLKQQSARVQTDLHEIQAAIESAKIQGDFTDTVSGPLSQLSYGCAVIPGWGFIAAGSVDGINVLLNAARDTHNERVIRAVERFNEDLTEFMKLDRDAKKSIKDIDDYIKKNRDRYPNTKTLEELVEEYGYGKIPMPDPDEDPGSSDDENPDDNDGYSDNDCDLTPVHDPSGIVYEAVLSNPVEGAEVTLSRYEGASDPLSVWDDSDYLQQANPILTDENGCYRWDVPEGEWFVTASKSGYISGSSQDDRAATVTHDGVNYLPVLPPQLNVNIPLVSYKAPEVESATAKTDGVYITFSKYMDESRLTAENFTLTDPSGEKIAFRLEKLDSEQAPDNINYSGGAPSYTRTVKLSASLDSGDELTLKVSGDLLSYAGVAMNASYMNLLSVESKKSHPAPRFSAESGEVEKGTVITLSCDDGAEIIYTTDGSDPSAENGIRVKNGAQVSLIISTTLKAIAVGAGSDSSTIAEASYTVNGHAVSEPTLRLKLGDVDGDGFITIVDATMIQRHLASLSTTAYHEEVADTDGDNSITVLDATAIQRFLAELSCPDGIGEVI